MNFHYIIVIISLLFIYYVKVLIYFRDDYEFVFISNPEKWENFSHILLGYVQKG